MGLQVRTTRANTHLRAAALAYIALCGFWIAAPDVAPAMPESVAWVLALFSGPPSLVLHLHGAPVCGHLTQAATLFAGSSLSWWVCLWGAVRTRRVAARWVLGTLAVVIWLVAGTCAVAVCA